MSVVIIDYGSGNLRSAANAFERAVAHAGLSLTVEVSGDPEAVRAAQRVVLPGVGAFSDCRRGLLAIDGMAAALRESVFDRGRPFMGICVGMQLMATTGREHGEHDGLGWIDGEVVPLQPTDPELKIPHMGWNNLVIERPHPVLEGLGEAPHAYFVHGYHFKCANPVDRLATVNYGETITAMIGRDNMVGTQFHPEKSQAVGLKLISNFLTWKP